MLVPVTQRLRREIVDDPKADLRDSPQIVGKLEHFAVARIGHDAFGQHQNFLGTFTDVGEKLLPQGAVGEIEPDPIKPAIGALVGKPRLLEIDHVREVHLDPAQRVWQLYPVGPRIETGAEIENCVDPLLDCLFEELVDDHRADHDRPAADEGIGHGFEDLASMVAGQRPGQGVAEKGLRSVALQRAKAGDQESRIGDVLNNLIMRLGLLVGVGEAESTGGQNCGEPDPYRKRSLPQRAQ
jgi:hypothetical protein